MKVTIESLSGKFDEHQLDDSVLFAFIEYGEKVFSSLYKMLENGTSNEKRNCAHAIRQWWLRKLYRDWIWKEAVPLMINNLTDQDYYTRGYTAIVLCDIKSPDAFEKLLDLAKDHDEYVRHCFASSIVNFDDQRAIEALEWILENDKGYRTIQGFEAPYRQYNADVAKQSIARLKG